jgi:hypothetical protein
VQRREVRLRIKGRKQKQKPQQLNRPYETILGGPQATRLRHTLACLDLVLMPSFVSGCDRRGVDGNRTENPPLLCAAQGVPISAASGGGWVGRRRRVGAGEYASEDEEGGGPSGKDSFAATEVLSNQTVFHEATVSASKKRRGRKRSFSSARIHSCCLFPSLDPSFVLFSFIVFFCFFSLSLLSLSLFQQQRRQRNFSFATSPPPLL